MARRIKIIMLSLVLFGCILIVVINRMEKGYREHILKGDYGLTIGQITSLTLPESGSELVEYEYVVRGKKYDRVITSKKAYDKYQGLDNSKRRFLVIYLLNDPKSSLISFYLEYNIDDSLKIPKKFSEIEEYKGLGDSIVLTTFK